MAESNTYTDALVGWFWSPEEPSEKLPGRLETEPSGQMRLEVINQIDSVDSEIELARMDRMPIYGVPVSWYLGGKHSRLVGIVSGKSVSGRTVRDTAITLDDCHLLTSGWLSQPRQIAFVVNRAYIGVALEPDEELQCRSVSWVADGIEGWLNPAGPIPARYEKFRPPAVSVSTAATIDGLGETEVMIGLLGGFSREKGNTYEIRESGYTTLRLRHQASWEAASEGVYHTHRFLRFALNRLCSVNQITLAAEGRTVEVVEQMMRNGGEMPYRPGQVRFDALFTADPKEGGVVGDTGEVLRRWLELPRSARGTLIRLHGLMGSSQFVDSQAVSTCGAAELWYTQVLSQTDDTDRPIVDPLPDDVEKQISRIFSDNGWRDVYGRRIKPVLESPNQLSTGEKVRGTFDPIEREVMGLSDRDRCEVSSEIVRLRHPWSHGDVPNDQSLDRLSGLVRKSRAMLKLRVLDYLGVDWKAVVQYNKTLHWELGLEERWHAVPYPVYEDVPTLDACLNYLRRAGGWRALQDIADALTGGGWKTTSKNPKRVVSHRLGTYMKEGGCVERVRLRGKVHWRYSEGLKG